MTEAGEPLETSDESGRPGAQPTPGGPRFPELQELQEDIQRRIRNNQSFLQRFMEEDFQDEDEDEDADAENPPPEDLEEL